jgi:hypothetical protein
VCTSLTTYRFSQLDEIASEFVLQRILRLLKFGVLIVD